MLHGGERTLPGEGSAHHHIEGDLFIGRPLGVEVFGRIGGQGFEDFRARRAGISGSDLNAGLPGAARDRLVTGQWAQLIGLAVQRLGGLPWCVHCELLP